MNYHSDLQKMAASGISPAMTQQYDSHKQPRATTEIEECLDRAGNAVDRLNNRIDVLEDRLRPLMRAVGSGTDCAEHAPKEALSPLGDSIRNIESRADIACERLEALLNGLAL